jgi:hypothetical protein
MATITRSQNIMIIDENTEDTDADVTTRGLSCCAYLRGIPPCLAAIAEAEGWTLPHVITETWEEEIPE